jgi:AraC family transcriptional regulator of adaptative response / DNA-3-methyladenine glycosylase II
VIDERVHFDAVEDLDTVVASLLEVQGIGPWTAHYMAMRACGEPDAFPSGDLVLRRVAARLDPRLGPPLKNEKLLIEHASAWRPWRAYASMFLWRAHVPEIRNAQTKKPRTNVRNRRTRS